jgi:hypothetical protein
MTSEPQLCNLLARARGLDPIGYAGTLDAFLAFEVPLPWPRGVFESRRKLPAAAHEALAWFTGAAPYRLRPLIIAPDPLYSVPGHRRVLWLSRPERPFAEYDRVEYLVPQASLGELVAALVMKQGEAPEFDRWRTEGAARDLLVCTHGAQDTACGLFGVPIYRRLRGMVESGTAEGGPAEGGDTRVWRVSHFGGHVFAPTLLDLPSGRMWAYLDDDDLPALLERAGKSYDLRGHYRGWAGLEGPFLQALERELLVREGWGWLDVPKSATVLEQDSSPEPHWARLRIDAWHGARPTTYLGSVEISTTVPIRPRSDSDETKPYAQYRVTNLEVASALTNAKVPVAP